MASATWSVGFPVGNTFIPTVSDCCTLSTFTISAVYIDVVAFLLCYLVVCRPRAGSRAVSK